MPSDTPRDSCQSFLEAKHWTKLFGSHRGWELAINKHLRALGLSEKRRWARALVAKPREITRWAVLGLV